MEELDSYLFRVLFGGSALSKSYKMMANICPRLPVYIFSNYIKDAPSQSLKKNASLTADQYMHFGDSVLNVLMVFLEQFKLWKID